MAATVLDLLAQGHKEGRYQIAALVLMPNHVHLLVRPAGKLSLTMKWIKGTTARAANQILSATGKPFWQTESYDRLARNSEEFHRIANYIEANPELWRKLQLAKGLQAQN